MHNNSTKSPSDLVELGRVLGAYGVRGWVKIEPYSAESDVLLGSDSWWLRRRQGKPSAHAPEQLVRVQNARNHSGNIVAQLDGVLTREEAAQLRGATVLVARAAFPQLPPNEYYWVDLIGCLVYGVEDSAANTTPVVLGRVAQVTDNGAHAVLHVHRLDHTQQPVLDAKGRPAELLVPFVEAHVHNVDLTARRIHTDWPVEL